jgi:tetratricopeptide (TPR) repeat protein
MEIELTAFVRSLKEIRIRQGLSLEGASSGICSASYLSLVEAGKRKPSLRITRLLAKKYSVSLPDLDQPLGLSRKFEMIVTSIKIGDLIFAESNFDDSLSVGEILVLRGLLEGARGNWNAAVLSFLEASSKVSQNTPLGLFNMLSLTKAYRDTGNMTRAVQTGEMALQGAEHARPDDRNLVTELCAVLASVHLEIGDLGRAGELTAIGLRLASSTWEQVMAYWALARFEESSGNLAEALEASRRAQILIGSMDSPINKARLLNIGASIELQTASPDLEKIRDDLGIAETILRDSPFTVDLAACLSTLGDMSSWESNEASTRQYYQESLALLSGQDHEIKGRIHASLASSLVRLELYEDAKRELLNARSELENNGASRSTAMVWRQMADLYELLAEPSLALACLKATADLLGVRSKAAAGFKTASL